MPSAIGPSAACHGPPWWRPLLALAGGLLAAVSAVEPVAPSTPVRNVVVLLVDDLGAGDLGCTGSTWYRTPRIDALAAESTSFTQAYASGPVCSPTRAALLTGRAPQRLRLTSYVPGPDRPYAPLRPPKWIPYLRLAEETLPELLAPAGLQSLLVGKWHLGGAEPRAHGFSSVHDPKGAGSDDDPKRTSELTERACRFISANRDRPFFAIVSYHAVHVPLAAGSARVARWTAAAPDPRGEHTNPVMAAMIEEVDESLGRIRSALAEAGISDRTAIIFTSDNGGLLQLKGEDGRTVRATSNAPLRGGKSELYEGGIRVPLIVHLPGRPAATSAVPVITADLAPTVLGLLGLPPRADQHLDGIDLAPLLRGGPPPARSALYWHYPHYQVLPPHAAVRAGEWKLVHHFEGSRDELFHLGRDPGERDDLAARRPDTVRLLRSSLQRHLAAVGAQLPTPNGDADPARAQIQAAQVHPGIARIERDAQAQPAIVLTPDPERGFDLEAALRAEGSRESDTVGGR